MHASFDYHQYNTIFITYNATGVGFVFLQKRFRNKAEGDENTMDDLVEK